MEVDQDKRNIRLGILDKADGCALYETEECKIIVAVYGPMSVKSKQEKIDAATVQVSFEPVSSPSGVSQSFMAVRLQNLLEQVLLVAMYPRSMIHVAIQPVKLSKSLPECFSAAFNASIAALLNADIPMTCVPIAIALEGIEVIYMHTSKEVSLMYHSFNGDNLLSLGDISSILKRAEEKSRQEFVKIQRMIHETHNSQSIVI